MKKVLITGITGQSGSYLADLLLSKNYEVHGVIRRSSSFNTNRLNHIFEKIHLYYGDLTDGLNTYQLIQKIQPVEIYHLGMQSHVRVSFDFPVGTINIGCLGTAHILEAVRTINPKIKIYNAVSSEMFGKVQEIPQTEKTPFYPRSPYGCSKVFSFHLARNYRESFKLFVSNGILFNHESFRRGDTFITKKIINFILELKKDYNILPLQLGNLDAKRDWGFAGDYVEAMWLMLQQERPDDFVIATGEAHSVREFCEVAFKEIEIDLIWQGKGINEKGINKKTNKILIEINEKYFRPAEVDLLLGDASKAKKVLGWEPKIKFRELIKIMLKGEEN